MIRRGLISACSGGAARGAPHGATGGRASHRGMVKQNQPLARQKVSGTFSRGKYPFGVRPIGAQTKVGIMIPTDFDRTWALIERVEEALRQAAPKQALEVIDLRSLCVAEPAG